MRAYLFPLLVLVVVGSELLLVAGCSKRSLDTAASSKPGQGRELSFGSGAVSRKARIGDQEEEAWNTEEYDEIVDNDFIEALTTPKSTFSIDVDTAAYSNVRRFINDGQMPPKGAVRIEELINYFDYEYEHDSDSEHPFSVDTAIGRCPWDSDHHLVRIALQGERIANSKKPDCNLVFLLDVSGSMNAANKLPLLKKSMRMLMENLSEDDRIAMVVYASASGVVLPSTSVSESNKILAALEKLQAGGSTNGGQGIEAAYRIAAENYLEDGVNRVILCTDGDFNVGTTDRSSLISMIQKNAKSGIELSVLGFGQGNLHDSTMEQLADKGNGNYAYIDSELEAKKSLVEEIDGKLITIAKDVKIQVDFNPARVHSYRLIGYENRLLKNQDFSDDSKDAGEIGSGHSVTALYELVPAGPGAVSDSDSMSNQDLQSEFVRTELKQSAIESDVILNVSLRYKLPQESNSQLLSVPLQVSSDEQVEMPTGDFQFAAAVATYGMLLRDSEFKGDADWQSVLSAAKDSVGQDNKGYRKEFVQLVRQASLVQ